MHYFQKKLQQIVKNPEMIILHYVIQFILKREPEANKNLNSNRLYYQRINVCNSSYFFYSISALLRLSR